jgi:small-conductance mechanosensitive channel
MFRHWFWLLLTIPLVILRSEAAHPQQKAPSQAADPFGALSPDQARVALDTLNDPKKRAAVAATLEALIKAQSNREPSSSPPAQSAAPPPGAGQAGAAPVAATGAKPPPEGIAIQLAPNSLGAQILLSASAFLSDTANEVSRAARAIPSIPLLWGWTVAMLTNPLGQQLLIDTGWHLSVTLALALGVWLALRVLLRRPMARVLILGGPPPPLPAEEEDPVSRAERGATEPPPPRRRVHDGLGRRIGLGLARFALQMVPVLGLLIAGHMAAASSLGGPPDSRLVILAVLDAIASSQTLLALLTLLFMPEPPGLKLLPLRPSAEAYLMRWGRRLILIAVPGYTIGVVALLLGLSPSAHEALQKAVGLTLTVCLATIVVQRRRSVRRWLSAPPEATGILSRLRSGLARYWHQIALFFLTATWLAWALGAPDATARILWYFVLTASVVFAAGLARTAALALLRPDLSRAGSNNGVTAVPVNPFRARLSVYHPVLRRLATLAINVLALLALSQLYGVGGLSWLLTTDVGQRIVSGIVTLTITIALAVAVWEGANVAIQLHLDRLRQGAQAARSARLRTLLPLIRTTLAITVAVVAGLMVLSEIGVNIAPLLAGAGIVGVAIGFGSQKLVQDVITGVFLLLENTMQVGDVVKVGDQSGLVESLSVRTIRLRTEDGSVVVIPFSAVTTVINMTRDYSRAVISLNVSVTEDVDRVIDAMRAIVREMREEEAWSTFILDELEVWGLDRITDTALQIKCRIMCTPFGRWPVSREFNRRLKTRFQVVGVATPFSALQLMPPSPGPDQAALQPSIPAVSGPGLAAGQ